MNVFIKLALSVFFCICLIPVFSSSHSYDLCDAAHRGDLSKVKALVASGENVNDPVRNITPFCWALYGFMDNSLDSKVGTPADYIEIVQLLLKAGCVLNMGNREAVRSLFEKQPDKNYFMLMDTLIAGGYQVNFLSDPPLYVVAIKTMNPEWTAYLLDKGADPNLKVCDFKYSIYCLLLESRENKEYVQVTGRDGTKSWTWIVNDYSRLEDTDGKRVRVAQDSEYQNKRQRILREMEDHGGKCT